MQSDETSDAISVEKNVALSSKYAQNLKQILYVILINPNAVKTTVEWFLELLQKQHSGDGRLKLKVTAIDVTHENANEAKTSRELVCKELLIQIDCDDHLLFNFAEKFSLRILRDNENRVQIFNRKKFDHLTYSEKQRALLSFIESVHLTERSVLFGYPNVKLYPGQSILQICRRKKIVGNYFPLHNESELNELKANWCFSLKSQPIDAIRNYFGDSIAFYFAFLEFYTKALIPPSIISLSNFFVGSAANPFCALFNIFWLILFLKFWKRRSNELAYKWDTINIRQSEEPRPAFKGKTMGIDPVTEKPVPIYPIYKTWLKEYAVSLPIVFFCLYIAFQVMLLYFQVEEAAVEYNKANPSFFNEILTNIPGIVYALVVYAMNECYRVLATKLNNNENHRTQTSHDNHLIVKLILFEFVNNFMSILYVAFYVQNLSALKWQIGTMLIVNQIVDNLQEVLIPLWETSKTNEQVTCLRKKNDLNEDEIEIIRQSKLPIYEDTYFDYLELFVQFGYVFLFSAIFPLAPILALLNNLIEIHSDSFKLCYAYQRPHQRIASGINNAWLKAFEVLSLIAVVSNCGLTLISPLMSIIQDYYILNDMQALFAVVIVEHLIFAVVLIINYLVPDLPKGVRIAIAKDNLHKQN
ncbi:anoctamin-10-like protein [Dinothrombium tinctorium]|uniref:Anoctamin n=1 Tax=Dinothrombium tinctorium TaxID=1965070 RepID=A0A3S3SGA0_9ACAR|nr:anoctamin-10-like protein [Dinothrombium tinctorium]